MRLLLLVIGLTVGCTVTTSRAPAPTTKPALPLPVHPLGGTKIPIFPLTSFTVQPGTGWDSLLVPQGDVRRRVDSILAAVVQRFAPEVIWVHVDAVRRAAAQATGMLANPDQLPTKLLQTHTLATIPEPLRAQLRTLTAVAAGGRYALVPAGLNFVWDTERRRAYADFTITLADVRAGAVSWSNTMRGSGETPWDAVAIAARLMFP